MESNADSSLASISGLMNHTKLVAVYSHITHRSRLHMGQTMQKGDYIGSIANTSQKKSGIPCHLHISIVEVAKDIPGRYA